MPKHGKVITGQANVVRNYHDEAWPEVFDIMHLDRSYGAQQIADELTCLQHLKRRPRRDYTTCILIEMERIQEEQGTFHLIRRGRRWIAPSADGPYAAIVNKLVNA